MEAHDLKSQVKKHFMVAGILIAMTFITISVSHTHALLALSIALVQAALIALFYMHLISERHLIINILVLTFTFILGLFLLPYCEFYSVPEGTRHLHTPVAHMEEGAEHH